MLSKYCLRISLKYFSSEFFIWLIVVGLRRSENVELPWQTFASTWLRKYSKQITKFQQHIKTLSSLQHSGFHCFLSQSLARSKVIENISIIKELRWCCKIFIEILFYWKLFMLFSLPSVHSLPAFHGSMIVSMIVYSHLKSITAPLELLSFAHVINRSLPRVNDSKEAERCYQRKWWDFHHSIDSHDDIRWLSQKIAEDCFAENLWMIAGAIKINFYELVNPPIKNSIANKKQQRFNLIFLFSFLPQRAFHIHRKKNFSSSPEKTAFGLGARRESFLVLPPETRFKCGKYFSMGWIFFVRVEIYGFYLWIRLNSVWVCGKSDDLAEKGERTDRSPRFTRIKARTERFVAFKALTPSFVPHLEVEEAVW